MQSDDVFCDMLNSINFLNMSKTATEDGTGMNYGDSGFNSGAEMNTDNIFFYEDSCPSITSVNIKAEDQDGNLHSNFACDHELPSPNYVNLSSAVPLSSTSSSSSGRHSKREKEFTQIQVNVGIDEDLKMILEMDPSLMDGTIEKAVESSSHVVDGPKILGLPPKMWVVHENEETWTSKFSSRA